MTTAPCRCGAPRHTDGQCTHCDRPNLCAPTCAHCQRRDEHCATCHKDCGTRAAAASCERYDRGVETQQRT